MKQLFLAIGLVLAASDCWADGTWPFSSSDPAIVEVPTKNECPHVVDHYYGALPSPNWTDLTPGQVKKCMQLYWKEQVDQATNIFTDQAKAVTDAYKHLGMWQQQ